MDMLTVLICTHNRASLLSRSLESINSARRPVEGVKLLVIANNCSDATHAMLDEYVRSPGDRLPLRWIAEKRPGKSHALNRGMTEVDTPLVSFVDDDHRIDSGYLEAIRDAARDTPTADIFCGRILPDWDGSEPRWVHDQGRYRIYPLPVPRFDLGAAPMNITPEVAVPGGGNLFLRTAWLLRVGPFATDLGPTGHDLGGAEDSDWVLRAFALGAQIRYVPDVLQYHYVDANRLTLGYIIHKAYKRTASTVRLHASPTRENSVPAHVYRKLASYVFAAVTAWRSDRRRFYIVRVAAALGEISGHRRVGRSAATQCSAATPPK
jgi:GT2 family glycosyltransferase